MISRSPFGHAAVYALAVTAIATSAQAGPFIEFEGVHGESGDKNPPRRRRPNRGQSKTRTFRLRVAARRRVCYCRQSRAHANPEDRGIPRLRLRRRRRHRRHKAIRQIPAMMIKSS